MHARATLRFVFLMCLLLLLVPTTAFGAANNSLSFSVDCDGITSNGGSLTLTRDNSGTGRENFAIGAVDGAGNVVFNPVVDSALVGSTISFGEGTKYAWSSVPASNPITVSIISVAGNSLAEETVYSVTGSCAGLAAGTAGSVTVGAVPAVSPLGSNTTVSPSVLPGQMPPFPTTNAAAIEQLTGYAIVNAKALNLRSGDGPQYTIVGVVAGGTRAIVLGRNRQFSWWLLDVGGVRGWANAEFLFLRGDLTDTPVIDPQGIVQPITFVTSLNQRVYREPNNLNRNYVCDIPVGEYYLVGKDSITAYYEVQAPCIESGELINAWIPVDAGAVRNPAGLSLPVTENE